MLRTQLAIAEQFPPPSVYSVWNKEFGRNSDNDNDGHISCSWDYLKTLLLQQWELLSPQDVDRAGPNRHKLAALIQLKYGLGCEYAENYLRNFERSLPLA